MRRISGRCKWVRGCDGIGWLETWGVLELFSPPRFVRGCVCMSRALEGVIRCCDVVWFFRVRFSGRDWQYLIFFFFFLLLSIRVNTHVSDVPLENTLNFVLLLVAKRM